ncbi:MAG: DUF5715 family protein [Rikenellaceae bacterium]
MKKTTIAMLCLSASLLVCGCKCSRQGSGEGGAKGNGNFSYFTGGFSRTFSDLNEKHLAAAREIGIDPDNMPEDLSDCSDLEEISTCRKYVVDDLDHSQPYLVGKAVDLLDDIANNFIDSLSSKDMAKYNIIVTSVFRSEDNVKSLRRKNKNASRNSAHVYGTTFDVAYTRYEQKGDVEVDPVRLKSVLAEVLRDLRKEDRCYVRYEVKQGCFHITAR